MIIPRKPSRGPEKQRSNDMLNEDSYQSLTPPKKPSRDEMLKADSEDLTNSSHDSLPDSCPRESLPTSRSSVLRKISLSSSAPPRKPNRDNLSSLCIDRGRAIMQTFNRHDVEGLKEFYDPHVQFHFSERKINLSQCMEDTNTLLKAFPDTRVTFKSVSEKQPGFVVFNGVRIRGTHQDGKIVENDEETMIYVMKNDKVTNVCSEGDLTGFQGLWKQALSKDGSPNAIVL